MVRSMTAFADGEIMADNTILVCELRSVNHRYSDVSVKLPERLRFAESDIRRLLAEKLKRGKIECSINFKKQLTQQNFSFNSEAVEKLLAAATEIENRMSSPLPFSALDVLQFPGVQQDNETNKEAIRTSIVTLLEGTLESMLETRSREGRQLAELIRERCKRIQQLVESARQRMPEVLSNQRNKILARVGELMTEVNTERLELELVMQAQKMDVDEELDRLDTHIHEVMHALNQSEPTGRRLDFLMQEMHREANTLGSKSADKEITQISIDLKVLIEQMREQIQNIE
jgi:uncharacterized protein (TIGR00255 family)